MIYFLIVNIIAGILVFIQFYRVDKEQPSMFDYVNLTDGNPTPIYLLSKGSPWRMKLLPFMGFVPFINIFLLLIIVFDMFDTSGK